MEAKEKFGMFKDLVGLFDTKGKATMTTILVLAVIYLVWDNSRDKDRLYGMVIEEVRKQVPVKVKAEVTKQTEPLKAAVDSNSATIKSYGNDLDTLITDSKKAINTLINKKK